MQHKRTSNDIATTSKLIHRLLSHYWTANEPTEMRQAQIEDWIEDLAEYGPAVVEGACQRWRRQPGGRRPTPGDIRQMCIEERRDYPRYYGIDEEQPVLPPHESTLTPQEVYARRAGWSSKVERDDAIRRNEERYAAGLKWQQENAAQQQSAGGFRVAGAVAAAMGVKAREYTPDELRAGRIALGLEAPPAVPQSEEEMRWDAVDYTEPRGGG